MKVTTEEGAVTDNDSSDLVRRITAHHEKFLSFLSARVEDAATAEDILQSTYIKAMQHGAEIRKDESTVAWFYHIPEFDHGRLSEEIRT